MDKLVSVIIPVYNVAPYLRESLDSVIKQNYADLEIIIVDDGSTDSSGLICDEYTIDCRVKVVHQSNGGVSLARNIGLDIFRGDYVTFLDPDDVFMPDMIRKMVDNLELKSADAVICGYDLFWTEGHINFDAPTRKTGIRYIQNSISGKDALNDLLLCRLNVNVWNKLYKRSVWDGVRFPEGHVYEDYWAMFQIFERCRNIITIPDVLVCHRKRKGSITDTNSIQNIKDRFLAHRKVEEYVVSHTPTFFSPSDALLYREHIACSISVSFAEICYGKHLHDEAELYKQEALSKWKALEAECLGLKSRITRMFFMRAPYLIIPMRRLWRMGKSIKYSIRNLRSQSG